MVIFWPVSGTALFSCIQELSFYKGGKPPPDLLFPSPLNKEAGCSVSMGIPMAHVVPQQSITCQAGLQCTPAEGPTPPKSCHRPSKTLPPPESFFSAISVEKTVEKPCSPQYFYFSPVDKRAFRWWTGIEFLCA